MILFILQNAYRNENHQFSNHDEWHRELLRSQTGRRLVEMIPAGAEFRVINASSFIGDNPNSVSAADTKHMRRLIKQIKPDIICACGKIAQDGCKKLGLDFIEAPHPAWRCLSKKTTTNIRNLLGEQNENL
jgi:Uracil DNA glycosylase superfamily.